MDLSYQSTGDIKGFLISKFSHLMPEYELAHKAEVIYEIEQLKKEQNAIILGHNYMEAPLYHTVADYTGDSLDLSRRAANNDADVILFCGVIFMAETAKILSPSKRVLIPSLKAGCSLASSITADDVKDLKIRFPNVPVITYVNSYADVKAECDACCTSANASQVVESFGAGPVIFLPDEYLSKNVAHETGRKIIFPDSNESMQGPLDNTIIAWRGRCEVHEQFTPQDISDVRKQFKDVSVLAHPECSPEVCESSDFSGSTKRMIEYVRDNDAPNYLLMTECAMGENIMAQYPKKNILRLCNVRCPHMNHITLEQTRDALKFDRYPIEIEPQTAQAAKKSLDYMLKIG
jgi:quinolinate synthase